MGLIPRKLEVSLPKFTMEQSYALHTILPAMGIQDVFKDTANFKGMSQEPGLKVSQVRGKTIISIPHPHVTYKL